MNLSTFVDVNTQDPLQMGEFLDFNAMAHETTYGALLLNGVIVEHYPMFTDDAGEDWKQIHYAEHLAWSDALTLGLPPDLSLVDLQDPLQANDWLTLHAAHHLLVNQSLGLE